MTGYFIDDNTWNGKVMGLDGTTEGFLGDFDAFFADDPTEDELQRRKEIPDLMRKDGAT
jgi:hypothetical protein